MSQFDDRLLHAMRKRDLAAIQRILIAEGTADIDTEMALSGAVTSNDLDVIRVFLAVGIGAEAQKRMLQLAAEFGHDRAVRCLLTASPDANRDLQELLYWAATENGVLAVRTLIRAGADVNIGDGSALFWATNEGCAEVIPCLLAAGADVHDDDDIALRQAASYGNLTAVDLLLAAGAIIQTPSGSALRQAARFGLVAIVQRLLTAHTPTCDSAADALAQAAVHDHHDAVRVLLAAGADPVIAWSISDTFDRRRMAASPNACVDALSPEQCIALAAKSPRLTSLRALVHASHQHQHLQRKKSPC